MFFHTGKSGDARSALVALDAESSDLRVMTIVDDGSRNYHVQPSPDGRSIAFGSIGSAKEDIFTIDGDGSHLRRLTSCSVSS